MNHHLKKDRESGGTVHLPQTHRKADLATHT